MSDDIVMTRRQLRRLLSRFQHELDTRGGKMSDDDLEQVRGNRDKLVGRIQERYGIAKEEANSQVDEWVENFREKMR